MKKIAHEICKCQNGGVLIICNVYVCFSTLFVISDLYGVHLKVSKELGDIKKKKTPGNITSHSLPIRMCTITKQSKTEDKYRQGYGEINTAELLVEM